MKKLIFVMLILPSLCQAIPRNLYLIVMAGQSNMVGAAPIPSAKEVFKNIYIFGNDDKWILFRREPIDSPVNQVDLVSLDLETGYGIGTNFARRIKELLPSVKIGLIPCAKGASSIFQWQRNLSASALYGSCLRRITAALNRGTLKAILFYQGEQEAINSTVANQWVAYFTQMVSDLRSDLSSPTMPIIFAKLPQRTVAHPWYPSWDLVRTNQATVNISNVTMVNLDTIDMALDPDDLYGSAHLSASQYDTAGKLFAEALFPIIHF